MRSAGAAGTAGAAAATAVAGQCATAAGGIEEGYLAFNIFAVALYAAQSRVRVLDAADDFKFCLAILTDVFVNRHNDYVPGLFDKTFVILSYSPYKVNLCCGIKFLVRDP